MEIKPLTFLFEAYCDISVKTSPWNLCAGQKNCILASLSTHSSGSFWFITILIWRWHWPDWNITSALWWITVNFATDTDGPQRTAVKDVVYEMVDGGVLSSGCQTLWVSWLVKIWQFLLTSPPKAAIFDHLAIRHLTHSLLINRICPHFFLSFFF